MISDSDGPIEELLAGFPDRCFTHGHPRGRYARLRREAPLARHPELPLRVVSRYDDVMEVAADPVGFRLVEVDSRCRLPPTLAPTDPATHARHRELVAAACGPAVIRRLRPALRKRVRRLLDALPLDHPVEVVAALAAPLATQALFLLLGIPDDDWPQWDCWARAICPGAADPPETRRAALREEAMAYLRDLAVQRRTTPREDALSRLAVAARAGVGPTPQEIADLSVRLLAAGNEPARHAISGGLAALARHPAEWRQLCAYPELLPSAIEEIARWTSPVVYSLRVAIRETRLPAGTVAAGERVMLLYGSADFDEAFFGVDAAAFRVSRRANPNLAFGFGAYHCLGAAVARLELRVLIEELTGRFVAIRPAGPPLWSGATAVTGPHAVSLEFIPR